MSTFVKQRADVPDGFFEAEAAGLTWLAAAHGVRTATVIRSGPGLIELERVVDARPTADAARRFGRDLATTHSAGATAFGAPPPGVSQIFIGSRPMAAANDATWGGFYARARVLPFLEIAERVGGVGRTDAADVREACALIAEGAFDDGEPPARIHGDLWTGNVLWTADDVVLIDPAAHGGHRETDLAMLALFGCPYLEEVLAAYDDAAPLREGWRQRVPLHQLHPLAVHAAGHGAHYGVALGEAARATLNV